MKFAKLIASKAAAQTHLPSTAYVDYKKLKTLLGECKADAFTKYLLGEIEEVRTVINSLLVRKPCCTADIGPIRLNGQIAKTKSPEYVDTLFECIELNREACRKISKKYAKQHPGLSNDSSQETEKLLMFDTIMKDIIDDVETWGAAAVRPMLTGRQQKGLAVGFSLFVVTAILIVVLTKARALQVAFVVGLVFSLLTAWGNAANDICNCVGTAVGAKALTLAQAVYFGIFFEMVGCLTMGPFVAKSITKGMIKVEAFEDTPELFAFCMVSVMVGTATVTLLATAYGFPISATHGVIGGLVAVGCAAKGPDSVGWEKLSFVCLGWIVAPVSGALVGVGLYLLIQLTVFKSANPAKRARMMQPFFLWLCFTVNVAFIFIKGPKPLRIKPLYLAVLIAGAAGAALLLVLYPLMRFCQNRQKTHAQPASASVKDSIKEADLEFSSNEGDDAPKRDIAEDCENSSKAPTPTAFGALTEVTAFGAPTEVARSLTKESPIDEHVRDSWTTGISHRGKRFAHSVTKGLGLDEDPHAQETSGMLREFTFRGSAEKTDVKREASTEASKAANEADSHFVMLLCISAFSVAVAHGGNDVGNATGPLSAILGVINDGTVAKTPDIPMWATIYGAAGFALGILTMGRLTIKTVGTKIAVLSPSTAFCTQIGGAVAVLSASSLGMPVSTSHCLVGAVVGIGAAESMMGTGTLNLKVLSKIFIAWIVTIPLAMGVTLMVFLPFRHYFD